MNALPRTDAPRANRGSQEIHRKMSLLRAPHVAPLTDYVEGLRAAHPDALIPTSIRQRQASGSELEGDVRAMPL